MTGPNELQESPSDTVASAVTRDADWQMLARAAADGAEQEEAEAPRELITFLLADSAYAIEVERVREIVRMRQITPMPRVPSSIIGVVALRGEVVQVVDLRARMNLPTTEATRATRIIVLHGDEGRVTGVLVDRVQEVLRVADADVRPAGAKDGSAVSEMCVRDEEFVSIVDVDRVLDFDVSL